VVVVAGATVIAAVVAPPGDHEYVPPVVPGVAVNVAEAPAHIVGEFTVTDAARLTVTVAVAVLEPQLPVEVTVYVVVAEGEAVTLAPVVALSPVAGAHE
jgi:hypothetical protein